MKKMVLVWFLLLSSLVLGQSVKTEFSPNTAAQMTIQIELVSNISLHGTFSSSDYLKVKALTFQDFENQHVVSITEELRSGENVFYPTYETENENRFAVFNVEDLARFGTDPAFELRTQAVIQTQSRIGLLKDFNLDLELRENREFLQSSAFIQTDSPQLQSKSKLEFGSDSQIESMRTISEWVNQNIEYDFENYYSDVYSAVQTYQNRAGVCDEFANLTAAFLRIKGIPTKYVTGISFDGTRFGNHGWLEAFLPGTGWVGVDSTYGEAGYVDAAHVVLAKGLDHDQIQNIVIFTQTSSTNPVQIETTLQEPIVSISEVRFWNDLFDVTIDKPVQLQLGQVFDITATISSRLDKEALVPVSLVMHSDFSSPIQNQIVWLSPQKPKTVLWKAIAPDSGKPGFVATYEFFVQLPDQQIRDSIRVLAEKWSQPLIPQLQIQDISPLISENRLSVHVTLQNDSDKPQTAWFEFSQNDLNQSFVQTIPAHAQNTAVFEIAPIQPGHVQLRVTGAIQREFEIWVPEQTMASQPIVSEPSPVNPVRTTVEHTGFFERIIQWIQSILVQFQQLLG